ncbi:MAG: hypothetical protein H7Y11_05540 [Armatimonadetes bacterium]|nr:hypothetical protein [Anaerolineae bacterium]
MSALEQAIIEKFQQLQPDAQLRVQALITQTMAAEPEPVAPPAFDFEAWVREIEAIREQIRISNGGVFPSIDVVGMLREIRDGDDER